MTDQERREEQRRQWKLALAELAKRNRRRQIRSAALASATRGRVGMIRVVPPARRQDGQDGNGAA